MQIRTKMSSDNNYAAYIADKALYLEDIARDEKEKICEDFQSQAFIFADDDSIVYLDEYNEEKQNGELYYKKYGSEKKKIADDVAFINEAKEIYLSIKGEKPEKVISDTAKYSKI